MKHEAEERRKETVLAMADRLECEVGDVVRKVGLVASDVDQVAERMVADTERRTARASKVASASELTSGDVQTAASATEQLNASISDISRQIGEASSLGLAAVSDSDRAAEDVGSLTEAA